MKTLIPDLFRSIGDSSSLAIRGYCQTDRYRCGLSAAWTVVKFFQPAARLRSFQCDPLPKWGLSTKKMLSCLRGQGLHVSVSDTKFWKIQDAINKGCPVLTSIGGSKNDDHWIVIYGFTETHILYVGRVLPGFTRTWMDWKRFKKRCNEKMLIVYD